MGYHIHSANPSRNPGIGNKVMKTYSRNYCPPELKDIKDVTGTGGSRAYRALYKIAAELAPNDTWAEFGVGCGHNTTKHLRHVLGADGHLYLFDSWTGIPEAWKLSEHHIEPIGKWKFPSSVGIRLQQLDNRLIITDGFFKDTIPNVLFPEQLGLIHIDCDIYSSTRDVLFGLNKFIDTGTVIIFDELIGYQCYEDHEYKALQEWLEETERKMEWHAKESFAVVGVVS